MWMDHATTLLLVAVWEGASFAAPACWAARKRIAARGALGGGGSGGKGVEEREWGD